MGLGGVRLLGLALGEVAGPPAAIGPAGVGVLVELQHLGHRAVEEGPVVRHDHGAPAAPGHQVLEQGEAVEVEVVGRLVEQGDVEAGQEDGGQGGTRLLAARERGQRLVQERGRQGHLVDRRREAPFEVAGRHRLVAGEGVGVAVGRPWPARRQRGRGLGQVRLGGGDAGAALQGGAHRLVILAGVLLTEIAHGRGGRVDADLARVGDEQSRQDLEEGRLADTVGAHDAEAGGRPHRERDVVEDGTAAPLVMQVAGDEDRRRCGGESGHGELRDEVTRDGAAPAADTFELYITTTSVSPGSWGRAMAQTLAQLAVL